ncbi:MAG: putative DNA-binding domain-containing protein [Methylococcaceae bacterium]|jgi:hypothetical protein
MALDFKAKQAEFTAHIRDPLNHPAPDDVNSQRMAMYRELIFNNVEGFLATNFPVIRHILDEASWLALTQNFLQQHRCESPYFSEIPEEFLAYLQNHPYNPTDWPFLLELAHYEWVEMALSIAKDEITPNPIIELDLHQHSLQLSPLAWPLAYQYPVQKIAPDFLPTVAPEQATFLVVYRDQDDDVNFLQITPITYRLLQIIEQAGQILADQCLAQLATEFSLIDAAMLRENGLRVLQELAEKNLLLFQTQ